MRLAIVLTLFLILQVAECIDQPLKEVSASEILDKIAEGKPVEYDHVIIKGNLSLDGLSLPIRHIDRDDFEIELWHLSENVTLVRSPLTITNSVIDGDIDLNNAVFNNSIDFSGSQFNSTADFRYSEFNSTVNFGDSRFNSYASFHGSKFYGTANFTESNFNFNSIWDSNFNDFVDFASTEFNSTASFWDSEFNDGANFVGSKFNSYACFTFSKFYRTADFRFSEFCGYASFWGSKFNGYANFLKSNFNDTAYFGESKFYRTADFQYSEFNSYAYFGKSKFNSTAEFVGSKFNSTANFWDSEFNNTAFFEESKFNSTAFFRDSEFNGHASFRKTKFNSDVDFVGASFNEILSFSFADAKNIKIDWFSIKHHNLFESDRSLYIVLIKYFNDIRDFEAEDDCYYHYRNYRLFSGLLSEGQSWTKNFIDFGLLVSCGYGVKPLNTILLSSFLIFSFGFIYWRAGVIQKRRKKAIRKRETQGISFKDAVFYSASIFFTLHPTSAWVYNERWRYLIIFEDILGWILMTLFVVTMGHVMLR